MFSYPLFERLKASTPEFEEAAAFQAGRRDLSVRRKGLESVARPLRSEFVTGNYFSMLGVGAFGGRVFSSDDDKPAAAPVAVLSHQAWQATYGSDPAVLGSSFIVEGHPFTVIGVAPPGFFGETLRGDPPDIWIPLQQERFDRRGELLASVYLRVAAHDWPTAAGSFHRRNGSPAHGGAAAMDAERLRISR